MQFFPEMRIKARALGAKAVAMAAIGSSGVYEFDIYSTQG